MKILLAGPRCSGKSTIGKKISEIMGIGFCETDALIEDIYQQQNGKNLKCPEIYRNLGESGFRNLEQAAVEKAATMDYCVIALGGGTLNNPQSRLILRQNSIFILVKADTEILWQRHNQRTNTAIKFNDKQAFETKIQSTIEQVNFLADIIADTSAKNEDEIVSEVMEQLSIVFHTLEKSPNTLGEIVRITTFGESHGPAVGAVLDGVSPNIELSEEDIQKELDRRRPGQSKVTTPRNETDKVKILSGVFNGKTTGAPIALVVQNCDQDSSKYEAIADVFRPGHADLTFFKKFGIRDHRGGGRSSGRETTGRVAGGAVAKKILHQMGIKFFAYSIEIAGIKAKICDYNIIEQNPVRCADAKAAILMENAIIAAKKEGNSVGGIVQLEIKGVPAGLGDPVFGKLEARLGSALLSIGAVRGVEFGVGFACAAMKGNTFNDAIKDGGFLSNNSGGIAGGITNGADIVLRIAVRPTPSISLPQDTVDISGQNRKITIEGRHDPCIVPRIIPVVENMAALVVLDAWEIQSRLNPNWQPTKQS